MDDGDEEGSIMARLFRAKCAVCGKELPIWADTWKNAMWVAGQHSWRFEESDKDAVGAIIQNTGTSWHWYLCSCPDRHLPPLAEG